MPEASEAATDTDPKPTPDAFIDVLLRNEKRAAIMDHLTRTPGMNRHQLAKTLGIHVNAVDFHIQRLAAAGLVEVRPSWKGRETLCFTAENASLWENAATRVLFGRGQPRQVAEFLAEHPAISVQEAADALGVSIHAVRRHIRTLESCDLVQRLRVERQVIYHAEPELLAWLHEARVRDEQAVGSR